MAVGKRFKPDPAAPWSIELELFVSDVNGICYRHELMKRSAGLPLNHKDRPTDIKAKMLAQKAKELRDKTPSASFKIAGEVALGIKVSEALDEIIRWPSSIVFVPE